MGAVGRHTPSWSRSMLPEPGSRSEPRWQTPPTEAFWSQPKSTEHPPLVYATYDGQDQGQGQSEVQTAEGAEGSQAKHQDGPEQEESDAKGAKGANDTGGGQAPAHRRPEGSGPRDHIILVLCSRPYNTVLTRKSTNLHKILVSCS